MLTQTTLHYHPCFNFIPEISHKNIFSRFIKNILMLYSIIDLIILLLFILLTNVLHFYIKFEDILLFKFFIVSENNIIIYK